MSSTIAFNYNFRLDDGTERIFTLQLEASTLDLISEQRDEQRDEQPAWTALECQQCPQLPAQTRRAPPVPHRRQPRRQKQMAHTQSHKCRKVHLVHQISYGTIMGSYSNRKSCGDIFFVCLKGN